MKNFKLPLLALALCLGFSAKAQQSATATATASIVAAVSCSQGENNLAFGAMNPDATAATTLALSPAETTLATTGGSGSLILYTFLPRTAADFNVTGIGTANYTVTLPNSATLTNQTDGTTQMTVDNFTTNLTSNIGTLIDGASTFYVGGTLNISGAQPVGSYSGTFQVTVNYN
ncbi:uncharacterized protein DUF4402 [Jejuia pallidilutea]|uniref:Uncharacterized protein DUF4402 n=1 Tax=Jejuia pallidilutea TaxID=504487 RepID=A0A362X3R1_9FLAO|nr:DUF4402 domain-containing protein [Jejuia pallidilutea]PQV49472.1 uncharacterized protein DUF4402 [Jejuia pallidilutea]